MNTQDLKNLLKEKKLYCDNCRFACQATECECVCHTQNEGFDYGFKQGITQALEVIENRDREILEKIDNWTNNTVESFRSHGFPESTLKTLRLNSDYLKQQLSKEEEMK